MTGSTRSSASRSSTRTCTSSARQANASPAARHLYREVLREIENLRDGSTDGHHALGYERGKGDLRDCVTAYVRSDPSRKPDYRLVFREVGPSATGQRPRRELLAIKPRHGRNNIYMHVCARLNRHPNDRQPGLNRFGERRPDARGSQSARQAVLDANRAIAHAWSGLLPPGATRAVSGQRRTPEQSAELGRSSKPVATSGRGRSVNGYPRQQRTGSEPTGWPRGNH
ncbi:hypothetical protein [Kribbella sp. NPDC004536]|uniref:hypothetical protein n=1 Tax=Kribbella sp. NPDC004536 TaxID=3364106 RepID=UPI00367DD25F